MGSQIKRQGSSQQTKSENKTDKKLSDMPKGFSMEKKMGQRLGECCLLLRKMQKKKKSKLIILNIFSHLKKISFISQGDDYQILFTACKDKSRIIAQTSKDLGIKISKIGKICSNKKRSVIIDEKSKEIVLKNKGYVHQF